MSVQNLAAQAATITCLAGLAVAHPHLPGAYITVSQHSPRALSVQLDSPAALEAWREALGVDAGLVVADRIGDRPSLEFEATVYGVDFRVYAVYTAATASAGGAA
ncbi:hypothetical protein [Streptomyces sp. NPDC014995]|uniref:hypothetical protein n=1 Tax=Streptomyces sp. NPDC014995 TaxID=3364936 RepID=UPI0036FC167D